MRRRNNIEGDGGNRVVAMHSEPAHAGHPLQNLHLHLALHGFGRELQNDSQVPALLLFVARSMIQHCMNGGEGQAVVVVLRVKNTRTGR